MSKRDIKRAKKLVMENNLAKRRQVEVNTTDDWQPTVNGKVTAVLTHAVSVDIWMVYFRGGDDFGMEKQFATYEEAAACFELTTQPGSISIADLKEQGFTRW